MYTSTPSRKNIHSQLPSIRLPHPHQSLLPHVVAGRPKLNECPVYTDILFSTLLRLSPYNIDDCPDGACRPSRPHCPGRRPDVLRKQENVGRCPGFQVRKECNVQDIYIYRYSRFSGRNTYIYVYIYVYVCICTDIYTGIYTEMHKVNYADVPSKPPSPMIYKHQPPSKKLKTTFPWHDDHHSSKLIPQLPDSYRYLIFSAYIPRSSCFLGF